MEEKVKVLIVEDEFLIAEDIAMRLTDFGYSIVGCASSAAEAIKILEKHPVDIALLDINIQGELDGIDLAAQIKEHYGIPFIFLSSLANKQVVERAKDVQPSAYLLKPFNDRQVQVSIEMAMDSFSGTHKGTQNESKESADDPAKKIYSFNNYLFLKKGLYFQKVALKEILYLEASSNYTNIITNCGSFLYSDNLHSFEERLPSQMFHRVHRSFLVNIENITAFEGNIIYMGKAVIPISKAYKEKLVKDITIL
jgi:DNA-binding LytR/AlgR family response regulator